MPSSPRQLERARVLRALAGFEAAEEEKHRLARLEGLDELLDTDRRGEWRRLKGRA